MTPENTENKTTEFRASVIMPAQKGIATEHLEVCEGCCQRCTAHAVGVETIATDIDIATMMTEATYAQKQASDILTLNEKLVENINDMMVKLSSFINEFTTGMEAYTKTRDEANEALKHLDKKELTKWALYGRYIGIGVGMIITFVTGLAV